MPKTIVSKDKTIWPYLIGLLAVQNVIYAFKVSNTYINVIYILMTFLFLYNCFRWPQKMMSAIMKFDKKLKYFLITILYSIIPYSVIVISSGIKHQSYFNGIFMCIMGLTLYINILYYEDFRDKILIGLWHGVLINTLISLLQLIYFKSGSYFPLYNWFPQPGFYVSIPWGLAQTGVLQDNSEYLIFSYRAMGLFLECSYFIGCIGSIILLITSKKERTVLRTVIILILTLLIAMSGSANSVIFLFVILIYFVAVRIKKDACIANNIKKSNKYWYGLALVFVMTIITICLYKPEMLLSLINIQELITSLRWSFETANFANSDNNTRLTFMLKALSLIPRYPFGVGYNMAPTVLKSITETYTTYNYFITILLELGPLGIITYLIFIGNTIYKLMKDAVSKYSIALAVSVIGICTFQFANGIGFSPFVWVVFALSCLEKNDIRKNESQNSFRSASIKSGLIC